MIVRPVRRLGPVPGAGHRGLAGLLSGSGCRLLQARDASRGTSSPRWGVLAAALEVRAGLSRISGPTDPSAGPIPATRVATMT